MVNKLNLAAIRLKVFIDSFLHEERGAVDIVAIVILCAVAIALAVVFRDQLKGIIQSLLSGIGSKAESEFLGG